MRLLARETVDLITTRHTRGLVDRTFRSVYDRGLGVVIDSKRHGDGFGWFGPFASDATFGHQGFFSSTSFADPEHGLVVALTWNGVRPFDPAHDARVSEALVALYTDLGYAGS